MPLPPPQRLVVRRLAPAAAAVLLVVADGHLASAATTAAAATVTTIADCASTAHRPEPTTGPAEFLRGLLALGASVTVFRAPGHGNDAAWSAWLGAVDHETMPVDVVQGRAVCHDDVQRACWVVIISDSVPTPTSPDTFALVDVCREVGVPVCLPGFPHLSDFDFLIDSIPPTPIDMNYSNTSLASPGTPLNAPSLENGFGKDSTDECYEKTSASSPSSATDSDSGCYLADSNDDDVISVSDCSDSECNRSRTALFSSLDEALGPVFLNAPDDSSPFIAVPALPPRCARRPSPGPSLVLVGAGPGAADLVTVRGARALRAATLVVADRLVPRALLRAHVPAGVPVLVSRKLPGRAPLAQAEIERWLVDALRLGHAVVRLKGGDPHVFGRGAEELLAVRRAFPQLHASPLTSLRPTHQLDPPQQPPSQLPGYFDATTVPVAVVPGVSSAFAAPLAASVPVTHRGVADQVLVLTGRREDGSRPSVPPFCPERTTVVLMGVGGLTGLTDHLVQRAGYPADLPVAVVERAFFTEEDEGKKDNGLLGNDRECHVVGESGGCSDAPRLRQRVVRGHVDSIAEIVKSAGITAHATIIIGHVVNVLDEKGVLDSALAATE
ncbi:uroporphyrin-III C-methyltransferase [Cladochytrium tenue]|nr:uroporphyrin-III C-methyltransferase [Cladochytrium tenue]